MSDLSAFTKYDEVLSSILANEKSILGFLSAIFNFLARRTDFYHVPEGPYENIGFPPGVAEELVIKVLRTCDPKSSKALNWAQRSIDLNNEIMCSTVAQEIEVKVEADPDSDEEASQTVSDVEHTAETLKTSLHLQNSESNTKSVTTKPPVNPVPSQSAVSSTNKIPDDYKPPVIPTQNNSDTYNGAEREKYCWSQNIMELDVTVKLPSGVKSSKDLKVTINPNDITVACRNGEVIISDSLPFKIKTVDSFWSLSEGRLLLHLEKVQERWWNRLLNSEEPIDLDKIDCSRHLDELPEDHVAKVRELQWNQERKMMGLPTSDEIRNMDVLKKAWNAPGSPFIGQEFDPSILSSNSQISFPGKHGGAADTNIEPAAFVDDSSSDEELIVKPAELIETMHNDELSFLPEQSREKYIKMYKVFTEWRRSKGFKTLSDTIMLSYFTEISKTRKPSTLWCIYSMLKAVIKERNNIHIEKYPKLSAFLKKVSREHKPKKSRTFTAAEILQFLNEAPDSKFLDIKVVLIIGVSGACRRHELTYLTTKNIEKHSDKLLIVKLSDARRNMERNFAIRDEYVKIVEKYRALRPANTPINRFFLQYHNGKCIKQPIGTNKMGGLPQKIATFLNLDKPAEYTGHCFRRTAAALSFDSGADLTTLRPAAYKCNTVPEEKVQEQLLEEPIDRDKIDCSRPLDELPEDHVAKVRELQLNQKTKLMGLPTSNEIRNMDVLKKEWNAPGSPFIGGSGDKNVEPAALVDDSSSDEELILKPAELIQTVHNDELIFLPDKSREKYVKAYELFTEWRRSKGFKTVSESIMLSYFTELSKTRKPNTLWCIYSMLKAVIKERNNIHIEKYSKLLAFLKKVSKGDQPKKSRTFTAAQIFQFLNEAPDSEFLDTKVVLIIGVSGACMRHELTQLTTKNVEKHSEKLLVVKLPCRRTNMERNFLIRDEYVKIVEKYQALRPANTTINRFFLRYCNGKCIKQPMGTHKIGGMPQKIATFLNLVKPAEYTGHCFRRTAAVLFPDSRADLTTLRPAGGKWNTAPEG